VNKYYFNKNNLAELLIKLHANSELAKDREITDNFMSYIYLKLNKRSKMLQENS